MCLAYLCTCTMYALSSLMHTTIEVCTMRSPSEFQLLQHGCWHCLPRCGHQLGARWPIIENVAWSTYEIASRSMLIKTIRSINMFSTGLTHGADGAPYSFKCRIVCHDCCDECDQLKLKFVINLLALIDLLQLIYESKFWCKTFPFCAKHRNESSIACQNAVLVPCINLKPAKCK
jgi:hypothetical protein